MPTQAAIDRATIEVHGLFKADYAKKKPGDKQALATRLLQEGLDTRDKDKQAFRFVCLRECRDLAAKGFDFTLAFKAAAEIGNSFDISPVELRAQAVEIANKKSIAAATDVLVGEAALALLDEVKSADAYEFAPKLLKIARVAARNSKNDDMRAAVARESKVIEYSQVEYDKIKEFYPKLEGNSEDSEANLAIGKYLCFQKEDWAQGLPRLASSKSFLAELAKKDLETSTDFNAQGRIGDAWWDEGDKESGRVRSNIQSRAKAWYRAALPYLTGSEKSKVEERLKLARGSKVFLPGLEAEYFTGEDLETKVLSRVDYKIHFLWKQGSPAPEVPTDRFSARWRGWLLAPQPGRYDLKAFFDDGCRVHLNGKLIIDSWTDLHITTVSVSLSDRPQRLQVEYHEAAGGAYMMLSWRPEGSFVFQPIPMEAFYHEKK